MPMLSDRPQTTRALTWLAMIAVTHVVLFGVVYAVTVRTVSGRQLGDASLRGALSLSGATRGTVDGVLDVVSIASLLGAMAVVATIALVRLARVLGLAALGILAFSNGSTWVLKHVVLSRPDLGLSEVSPSTLNSLPSGHATAVFSAVAALIFVLPHRWRLATATVGGAYAALTALATMTAGWHRAGDSVAAFLVVGFWTAVAAAVVVLADASPRQVAPDESRPAVVRWLLALTIGALVVGGTLAVGLDLADGFRESTIGSWTAFFAGLMFVSAAATGVLVGILTGLGLMESTGPAEPA